MKIRAIIEWDIPTPRYLPLSERAQTRENARLQIEKLGAKVKDIKLIDE